MDVTVLDLGSNSFQLLQARCSRRGAVESLFRAVEYVQLANHITAKREISQEGLRLGERAVRQLLTSAPPGAHKHPLTAVATCTIREAPNGPQFLDQLRRNTGVVAQVLSGEQEAQLAYHGAISQYDAGREHNAVVDLGGGSTEIAAGVGAQVTSCVSVRLGVLALVERFAAMPNTANVALDHLAVFVRRTMEPAIAQVRDGKPDRLVFASGVARVIRDLINSYEPLGADAVVAGRTLRGLIPTFLDASKEELRQRGVPEKRLNTVGPTAVVLDVITELFEVDSFAVAKGGLREGAALKCRELGTQPWPR